MARARTALLCFGKPLNQTRVSIPGELNAFPLQEDRKPLTVELAEYINCNKVRENRQSIEILKKPLKMEEGEMNIPRLASHGGNFPVWIIVSTFLTVFTCSFTSVDAQTPREPAHRPIRDGGSLGDWATHLDLPAQDPVLRRPGFHSLRQDIPISAFNTKYVTGRELELISGVVRNDFLINDDTTGVCSKKYPAAAMDTAGNFVLVWEDCRNGSFDIYAQRYDASGAPDGPNFRVNDNASPHHQLRPSVAMDPAGKFVVVWEDWRNGHISDVYAQRYDASGVPQDSNFQVNELWAENWHVSVAMDGSGSFAIAWADFRASDIYCQRYDSSGVPLGTNFKVDDNPDTTYQVGLSVSMNWSGSFVVAWDDDRGGNQDIYAQRYDSLGGPQGPNFRVDDDTLREWQQDPSVAMDSSGGFIIAWKDHRNAGSDIYLQRYDRSGAPLGSNLKVNDDVGSTIQEYPSLAMGLSGNFAVVWEDNRDAQPDVYAQTYDSLGIPQSSNFKINDDAGTSEQGDPFVAMDSKGDFAVVWHDERSGYRDMYSQRYDQFGAPQGSNFRVNDDEGSVFQEFSSAAMDANGNSVVVWIDWRNVYSDIYGQRLDPFGIPQGPNFMVNDDADSGYQYMLSVAMDPWGNFVIAWMDYRNGYDGDIYAQRYNPSGIAEGPNFIVNDDVDSIDQYCPSAAIDGTGNFVVAWMDSRDETWYSDIFAQRYDSSGTPQGQNFKVNDDLGSMPQQLPSVAMDLSGNFAIVWQDERNGESSIYLQRYDTSGMAQGPNVKVNDHEASAEWPTVAMDKAGDFVVAWPDRRNGRPDIYAQQYDSVGTPQGSNFRVNDDIGSNYQYRSSVAIDPEGGRFVVVWTDYRNPDGDPEVVAQKFENGIPIGPNVQINEPDSFPYNHQVSWPFCLASNHNMVLFTWRDNRRHKSMDIYAKLTDWNILGIQERDRPQTSRTRLSVYPNPFRNSVNIYGAKTTVQVYDLCGRLVARTEEGFWDGRDLNGCDVHSGIYFLTAQGCKPVKLVKLR